MTCKPSLIWKFYTIDAVEKQKAHCNICQAVILRGPPNNPSHYSTSPLFKHLKHKHPADHDLVKLENKSINGQKLEDNAEQTKSITTAPGAGRNKGGRSKGGRNKDPIWRLFRAVTNAAGILKAECALCSHQQAPVAKRLNRHMLHKHPGLLAPGLLDPKPLARAAADAGANDDEQDDEDGLEDGDGDSDYAPDAAHELSAQARRQRARHLLQPPSQACRAASPTSLDVLFSDAHEEPAAAAAATTLKHQQTFAQLLAVTANASASASSSIHSQSAIGMFCDVLVQEELVVRAAISRNAAATLMRRDVLDELSARSRPGVDAVCREVSLSGAHSWGDTGPGLSAAAPGTGGSGSASGSGLCSGSVTATGRTALKLELFRGLGGFTEVFVCEPQHTHGQRDGAEGGGGDGDAADVDEPLPWALVLGRPFFDAYLEEELEEDVEEHGSGLSIGPRMLLVGTGPKRKAIRLSSASCYMG